MNKPLLLIALSLLSSSCASTWVAKNYDPNKGGIIKYKDKGAGFVIEKRRNDAIDKMKEFCSPSGYKITSESNDSNSRERKIFCVTSAVNQIALFTKKIFRSLRDRMMINR